MKITLTLWLIGAVFVAIAARPRPTASPAAGGAVENAIKFVHDPSLIREGDLYYLFSTGSGIPIRRSRDLIHWELIGSVFKERVPAWAQKEIPASDGLWAPDICFFSGRFHLYYAVSSFGSNHSLIALASNKTLDPASPDYQWKDEAR